MAVVYFATRPSTRRRQPTIPARTSQPTGATPEPGRPYSCLWCGGADLYERVGQLNTPVLTFLNLDWANRTATCLVCRSCGHVHWFTTPR